MKALVTGASGFIGAHLVEALAARNDRACCLVRKTSQTARLIAGGQAELVVGDIGDIDSLRRAVRDVDVVFHLAGLVKALSYRELLHVNQQGTANLAQACAEATNPPVLVVVSSLAAAGPAVDGRPRIETDPVRPVSNYGRSKRAGELAAVQWSGRVPVSIVRPPVVFGEGDASMVTMFRAVNRLGLHLVPGFAVRQASMIHAADLATGLIAVADRGQRVPASAAESTTGFPTSAGDEASGCYFLAAERHPTFAEWGQYIADALGRSRFRVLRAPEAVGWVLAGVNEAWSRLRRRPHIFNLDKMREATAGSWICAPDRARRELEFDIAAPLAQRFQQTADWYRREGWL